jgi:hypothetical protein
MLCISLSCCLLPDDQDFPKILPRPELQDILTPPVRDSPITSVQFKDSIASKPTPPLKKPTDEKNPLFSSNPESSSKSSSTYKYYGSVDDK